MKALYNIQFCTNVHKKIYKDIPVMRTQGVWGDVVLLIARLSPSNYVAVEARSKAYIACGTSIPKTCAYALEYCDAMGHDTFVDAINRYMQKTIN